MKPKWYQKIYRRNLLDFCIKDWHSENGMALGDAARMRPVFEQADGVIVS